MAEGVIELYRRYRQADEQLAEIVGDRELIGGRSPHDQVSDFFYRRQNYVPDLDEAAESLAGEIGVRHGETPRPAARPAGRSARGPDRPARAPTRWPATCTATAPATRTLHLSTSLRPGQQAIRIGAQIALLEYADLIDETIEEEGFDDVQTQILTRVGLANYFAAALDPPVHARSSTPRSGCGTTSSC